MSRITKPKKIPGQLVRLTTRDYCLLLEGLRMAQAWRGGKMPDEWPEFDAMMGERWNALWKIRDAVYPKKPKPYTCQQCGQVIKDGKPCGCGARGRTLREDIEDLREIGKDTFPPDAMEQLQAMRTEEGP